MATCEAPDMVILDVNHTKLFFYILPGAIDRSVSILIGNQKAPRLMLVPGTSFREDLTMKIFLRPFFLFC